MFDFLFFRVLMELCVSGLHMDKLAMDWGCGCSGEASEGRRRLVRRGVRISNFLWNFRR